MCCSAERTKYYCCCTKDDSSSNSSTSHRHESILTHARNDHRPPTQPTARQPTNPSHHQTLQPICATAVHQQYVPAGTCTSKQRRLVRTLLFILKTQSWIRCNSSGVQERVNHPFSPINRLTTHPRTGTGTCCCMLKMHVPAIITLTTKTTHPR